MSKMLDEIREQPAVLERTLQAERQPIERLRELLERDRPRFILLAARGTSDNAAQFGRYLLEITTGIPVTLAAPSIFTLYQARLQLQGALVVAISQSGESTDTNLVLERAREQGASHHRHHERARQHARAQRRTRLPGARRPRTEHRREQDLHRPVVDVVLARVRARREHRARIELARFPEFAARALELEPEIARRAERYRFMERAVVIGRGLNYANAYEFALKLMETCYVVAERFSRADLSARSHRDARSVLPGLSVRAARASPGRACARWSKSWRN